MNKTKSDVTSSALRNIKRKSIGAITLEVCLTLPVIVYLIFFTLELIKINITQDALQSICEEATYLTMSHNYSNGPDLSAKVDAIIEKYRPSFIPQTASQSGYGNGNYPVIRYQYCTYSSLDELLNLAPYGGSTISYPPYERDSSSRIHASPGYHVGVTECIPVFDKQYTEQPLNYNDDTGYMSGGEIPNNRVFVLTVTCSYPFSSSMIKMLFNGGINTKKAKINSTTASASLANQPRGTMYILWARGAGIVNPK